jgi:predicted DNA-binding transcriptional regulator AlpA
MNRGARRHPATLRAEEVADRFGISTWALYESVRRGDCPVTPIKVGRRLLWPTAQIDRLLGLNDGGRPCEGRPPVTTTTPDVATTRKVQANATQ